MHGRLRRGAVANQLCALVCVLSLGGAVPPAASEPAGHGSRPRADRADPEAIDLDPAKVRLGERLFRDPRLSHDGRLACISCHKLDEGGDDGQAHSIGADGRPLDFNTPTVFNAGLSFRINWRGNFRTLEELAEAVLLAPRLMATSWEELQLEAERRSRLSRGVPGRLWRPAGAGADPRCARHLRAFPDHARRPVGSLPARRA